MDYQYSSLGQKPLILRGNVDLKKKRSKGGDAMPNRAFRKTIPVLSAILLFLLCINVFAQQTKGHSRKHSLWKINSKINTVYLLGSVHVLKSDAYPLDEIIEKAYENSPRLFFEINFGQVDAQRLQQLSFAKGVYHKGRTLKDDLSSQTYESVKKRLAGQGLNIERFERFKPWLLAMSLEVFAKLARCFLDRSFRQLAPSWPGLAGLAVLGEFNAPYGSLIARDQQGSYGRFEIAVVHFLLSNFCFQEYMAR